MSWFKNPKEDLMHDELPIWIFGIIMSFLDVHREHSVSGSDLWFDVGDRRCAELYDKLLQYSRISQRCIDDVSEDDHILISLFPKQMTDLSYLEGRMFCYKDDVWSFIESVKDAEELWKPYVEQVIDNRIAYETEKENKAMQRKQRVMDAIPEFMKRCAAEGKKPTRAALSRELGENANFVGDCWREYEAADHA